MNIVDLLLQDHVKLRRELKEIGAGLGRAGLRQRVKLFISHFELHESIEEDILFPVVDELPSSATGGLLTPGYEKMHAKVWALLDRLITAVDHRDSRVLDRAFVAISASVESHLSHEETSLFPALRKAMKRSDLDTLGARARERISKAKADGAKD